MAENDTSTSNDGAEWGEPVNPPLIPSDAPHDAHATGGGPDAPTSTTSANQYVEDEQLTILDRHMGPTHPTIEDKTLDSAAQQTPGDAQASLSSPSADDVKPDAPKSADDGDKTPSTVPYARFKEINDKANALNQKAEMLDYILANPTKFADMVQQQGTQPEPEPEPWESADILAPVQPKPTDEMTDQDWFDHAVSVRVAETLKPIMPALSAKMSKLDKLEGFTKKIEELMLKSSTSNGKPVYPRWDELRSTMDVFLREGRASTLGDAYVLADAYTPPTDHATSMTHVSAPSAPITPSTPTSRKATPAQIQAQKLQDLHRSAGAMKESRQPQTVEEAVAMAIDHHMNPDAVVGGETST